MIKISRYTFETMSFSEKVLLGVRMANRKLVEEAAAKNRSLVVKRNGVIVTIPARELLKTLPPREEIQNDRKG